MQFHKQQALRAIILLSFSLMIYKLHFTGEITKYINPKYDMLSQSAALMLLILFFIQITRVWTLKERSSGNHHDHSACEHEHGHCHHDHGTGKVTIKKLVSYVIIVFPILTGLFLPANVLDASMAEKKGGILLLSKQQGNGNSEDNNGIVEDSLTDEVEEQVPGEFEFEDTNEAIEPEIISNDQYENMMEELENAPVIEMNDMVYSSYYEAISSDIDKYKGRKIKLNGFIYKEDGFADNQLVISRFLITHCVADASIVGFLSELDAAPDIPVDTWVEAVGTFDITTYNGQEFPYLKVESWKEIDAPSEPYIYPVSVEVE